MAAELVTTSTRCSTSPIVVICASGAAQWARNRRWKVSSVAAVIRCGECWGARPVSGRPAAQWAGLPNVGAAWVWAGMRDTVPGSSWPWAVPSSATVSRRRAYA